MYDWQKSFAKVLIYYIKRSCNIEIDGNGVFYHDHIHKLIYCKSFVISDS